MARAPRVCRPEAFALFHSALTEIDSNDGLLRGAMGMAKQVIPESSLAETANRLAEIAECVASRVSNPSPPALLAHLHAVLFEEEQFYGNFEDYYSPDNSLLPVVLASRRGIPITLALVYKLVAEPLGLTVEGINAPGHFLARIHAGDDTLLVDPFFHGQMLSQEEAYDRIGQVTGRPVVQADVLLQPASHVQWLSRMLANLQNIFASRQDAESLAAMSELHSLLEDAY